MKELNNNVVISKEIIGKDGISYFLEFKDGIKEITKEMLKGLRKDYIKGVVIPDSVEKLELGLFQGCENLENVRLSNNLKSISNTAFAKCKKLKEITIPSSVEIIDANAFAWCEALETINFSEGLETIEANAFVNCKSLKTISLPDSLIQIKKGAFECCSFEKFRIPKNLETLEEITTRRAEFTKKIEVDAENKNFELVNGEFLIHKNQEERELILCIEPKNGIIRIPERAKITSIGIGCFDHSTAKEIILPEGIKKIKMLAFAKTENLYYLTLPDSVEEVEGSAFFKSNILELNIGKNLKSLTVRTFDRVTNLQKITVHAENEKFKTDESGTMLYDDKVLYRSFDGKFPQDVQIEKTGFSCFGGSNAEKIVIPDTVKGFGVRTFEDCKNLQRIEFGKKVEYVGYSLMNNNSEYDIELVVDKENEKLFDINKCGIFSKKEQNGKEVTSLMLGTRKTTFPENCETISNGAFAGNLDIKEIRSINSVSNLKEMEINNLKGGENTLYLPNSITKIDGEAFAGSNVSVVDLKDSNVKSIDRFCFADCPELEKVILPEGIQVDSHAFALNRSNEENKLKFVSIPFSMEIKEGNKRLYYSAGKRFPNGEVSQLEVRNIVKKENLVSSLQKSKEQPIINSYERSYKSIDSETIEESILIKEKVKAYVPKKTIVTEKDILFFDDNGLFFSQPIGYFKSDKEVFNKLDNLRNKDLYKVYAWQRFREENQIKKLIPPYFIVQNMPKTEIANFYSNLSIWRDLVEKSKLTKDADKINLFHCAHSLGLFQEDKAQSVESFILKAILPNLSTEDLNFMFGKFNSFENEFNPKFADIFTNNFFEKNEFGTPIKEEGKYKVKGKEFLAFEDYVTKEQISVLPNLHNNFEKLIKDNSNKNFDAGHGGASKLTEEDIIKTYRFVKYEGEVVDECAEAFSDIVQNIKDENGNIKYGSEIFENFINVLAENKEKQEHLVGLTKVFALGLVEWEKEENKDKRLICEPDTSNSEITYELLKKEDGHGAVLGHITDCCQIVGDNGGGCVEYGMLKPNSGFIVFRYKGQIVGQAWTWYDEKSKQVTLDNIEAPKTTIKMIESDENLKKGMFDCLERLCLGFKTAMGNKIERVTVGTSCNDMQPILEAKGYSKIPSNEIRMLEDYTNDTLTHNFGKNGGNVAYSDATKDKGQLMIKNFALEQTQVKESNREQ